jgi:hypothetical protein
LVGTLKAIKNYDLNHIVTFHSRVKRAKDFSTTLVEVNDVLPNEYAVSDLWTDHVSGNMPTAQRTTTLQKFRQTSEGVSLLSNARCLGEGVDVRAIDGVGFIDPRKSNIDIVQAVGRAIRKSDESKIGTIVLPVLLGDLAEEKVNEQLNSSRFSAIWDVLNALRAHDEVLAEQMDQLRFQLGRYGRTVDSLTDKIIIDVPTEVGIEFHQALETRIINSTTSSWEFWYGLLVKFAEREGHARPTKDHKEDGHNLGAWLQNIRWRKSLQSPEHIVQLESLPGWTWIARDFRWLQATDALHRFISREGHARPPVGHIEDGYPLARWVQRQRVNKDSLSPERVSELERLPGWAWDGNAFAWTAGFTALKKFIAHNGHPSPSKTHFEDGYPLGAWVSRQRTIKSSLDAEKIDALEQIPGWVWDARQAKWEGGFSALQSFIAREGHLRPPNKHVENGYKLSNWITQQRSSENTMSRDRRARLESLPGWTWNMRDFLFDQSFSLLEQFVAREGHALPKKSHIEEGYKLGSWVTVKRKNKSGLKAEYIARLESIPGWQWDVTYTEMIWERNFTVLSRFASREGHSRPSQDYHEDDTALGSWVSTQRINKTNLPLSRIEMLEGLPGWTWDNRWFQWEEGITALRKFVEREGHARPSQLHLEDGYRLGQWVANRRGRKASLSEELIAELESLPGWTWDTRQSAWDEGFVALERFALREGHSNPPQRWTEEGFKLGIWVNNQRTKKSDLSSERQMRLESLPGWQWNTKSKQPSEE